MYLYVSITIMFCIGMCVTRTLFISDFPSRHGSGKGKGERAMERPWDKTAQLGRSQTTFHHQLRILFISFSCHNKTHLITNYRWKVLCKIEKNRRKHYDSVKAFPIRQITIPERRNYSQNSMQFFPRDAICLEALTDILRTLTRLLLSYGLQGCVDDLTQFGFYAPRYGL